MRPRLLLFALLLLPDPAEAALITGYAVGTITTRSGPDDPSPYAKFVLGHVVGLEFAYDPDLAIAVGPGFVLPGARYSLRVFAIAFHSGVVSQIAGGTVLATDGDLDRVDLGIGGERGRVDLTFTDPAGSALAGPGVPTLAELRRFPAVHLHYGSQLTFGGQAFTSELTMVDYVPGVPEPPTALLAIVGGTLTAAWMSRRA